MLSNGATHYYYRKNLSKKKTVRSSRPEVFCEKGFIRNFAKFTGNYLFQSLFFNKSELIKANSSELIKFYFP